MKDDYNTMPLSAHRLELTGRERLTVSGVEDVERFDDSISYEEGGTERGGFFQRLFG